MLTGKTWPDRAVIALIFGVLLYSFAGTAPDPDLWGHVRFGQDMIQEGTIPTVDPYAYTSEGQFWINHEWLTELLFGAVFNAGGGVGLIALKLTVIFLIGAVLLGHMLRQGLNVVRAGGLLIAAFCVISTGVATVRPQLFTHLSFLLMLMVLHGVETGRRRLLWLAPPVVAIWVNFHGGVLAGLGILMIWAGARIGSRVWAERSLSAAFDPDSREAVAVVVCSWLASLANPYGWKLIQFLLQTATVPRPEISEWSPIDPGAPLGMAYLGLLAVTLAALYYSRAPKNPALMAVLAVCAAAPWSANRHAPLFAMAAAVFCAEHVASALSRGDGLNKAAAVIDPKRGLAVAAAFSLLAAAFAWEGVQRASCIRIDPDLIAYPSRAVALLSDSGVEGNLATSFNWGEFILWQVGPRIKVSIDGRRETVYRNGMHEKNLDFIWGRENWASIIEDYPTEMVLTPKTEAATSKMLEKQDWHLVYDDGFAVLFVRKDSPLRERLERTMPRDLPPDGAGLCFEAPRTAR